MNTNTSYENGCLTVTRVYEAPRATVFEAWIEASKVQQWWGCGDTTNVVSEIDPRVGGKYYHMMTIKDVHKNPVNGVITEFDPPALLAYEVAGESPAETMTVRVEFIEQGGNTEVRLTHNNIPDAYIEFVRPGWMAAFDKLAKFLIEDAKAA